MTNLRRWEGFDRWQGALRLEIAEDINQVAPEVDGRAIRKPRLPDRALLENGKAGAIPQRSRQLHVVLRPVLEGQQAPLPPAGPLSRAMQRETVVKRHRPCRHDERHRLLLTDRGLIMHFVDEFAVSVVVRQFAASMTTRDEAQRP